MPSVITHSLVGFVSGQELMHRDIPRRFWVLAAICPLLPDLDVIGLYLGIDYSHFFGHRGFFHSPFCALLISILVVCVYFQNHKIFSKQWWLLIGFFFLITASHGLLDAFTNGGLGIALLSPFDSTRYFFPWTPIQVSPIGFGLHLQWRPAVMISEAKWVWLPMGLLFLLIRVIRRHKSRQKQNAQHII